jgi:hypothetical protein
VVCTAQLDVASYGIELKMEIKLWKLRNISQRLCEEVAARKGTEAHTLRTTGVGGKGKGLKLLTLLSLYLSSGV